MNKMQELVRARLRDRTPNLSILAKFLRVDPSVIQKRLKEGGTALCLDFLDSVTTFYQMSVAEMCAMPGALWQEVKPMEAQLLAMFRDMSELERRSLLTILDRPIAAAPGARRRTRFGRHLSDKEQELVDLFARVKRDGVRDGVLKTLRGAAEAEAVTPQGHRIE